jgi:hypothetical protein
MICMAQHRAPFTGRYVDFSTVTRDALRRRRPGGSGWSLDSPDQHSAATILAVAAITVHWPHGFSSIKLQAVTQAGPQFGPPGYETNPLDLAALATLVLGGSGPWSIDVLIARRSHRARTGQKSRPAA